MTDNKDALFVADLMHAMDYATTRDAAAHIRRLVAEVEAKDALLREVRRWIGDGDLSDGLAHEHWTPAYASIIDRVDAAIRAALDH